MNLTLFLNIIHRNLKESSPGQNHLPLQEKATRNSCRHSGLVQRTPGESFVQVSTIQVFLDHFIHHRPKEPVLLLAMLIIAGLEINPEFKIHHLGPSGGLENVVT
jgi:hypothetical protein